MKIIALKSKIGSRTYYVSILTFQQVSDFVCAVDERFHKASSLGELIQRSLTNNVKSLVSYIKNQPDMFFNSIVLAVYDNSPTWQEIEYKYNNGEKFNVGLLEFP